MPWDLYADTLGINVSYAHKFGALVIIPASAIEAPVALIPVRSNFVHKDLWITVSYDHDTCEPEVFEDDDEDE
ncbi:hypothetical protein PM082_015265 [Marasmius tenuissimus]|nr:hypothetical protein PM082_015265 [Marasmius tenuissimus]